MIYALELQKISKTYSNGMQALKKINLNIKIGDFYALLGHNGAGKSTIIGIISSLIKASSGEIKIFGYNLHHNLIESKSKIGIVPQEFNFNLFETVIQILINQAGYYGIKKKDAIFTAEIYLKKLDLWEKRHQSIRMLSSGMKRRLMIVRALIHNPKLLILDEPTAGVDIELRRIMWFFLKDLNDNGTTVILTTHYLEEAEMLCRNIGIIEKGRLIENTSMKDLLSKLKSEIFILDIETKKNFYLDDIKYQLIDKNTLEVEVLREKGLNILFQQLNQKNIKVLSMRNKTNRLEELFIKLTKYKY